MATCTDDAIIQHVLPFVSEHITNVDWKFRDAAVMALGSIMEGPDSDKLTPLVAPVSKSSKHFMTFVSFVLFLILVCGCSSHFAQY